MLPLPTRFFLFKQVGGKKFVEKKNRKTEKRNNKQHIVFKVNYKHLSNC